MLLAIDTTNELAGVALYAAQGLIAEANWRVGRGHSSQVLAMIDQLFKNLGHTVADLSGIGVAIGPGSWSGLRVGLSIAKGIALTRDVPLLGVSSLEVLAYPHQRTGRIVIPILRLGRDRYACSRYRLRRSWSRVSPERNLSKAEIIAELPDLALVCGEVDPRFATEISAAKGDGIVIPMPAIGLRRAGYLAEIAWARLQAGERDDPIGLEPTYLGNPVRDT